MRIWTQLGHLCAHNTPGASRFNEDQKKGRILASPCHETAALSDPAPHVGSLYCVHLERTAEIPNKRLLFSLSSHLYSATTYLPQAPSAHNRFSYTIFQGTTNPFWELTAILHFWHLSSLSH